MNFRADINTYVGSVIHEFNELCPEQSGKVLREFLEV